MLDALLAPDSRAAIPVCGKIEICTCLIFLMAYLELCVSAPLLNMGLLFGRVHNRIANDSDECVRATISALTR